MEFAETAARSEIGDLSRLVRVSGHCVTTYQERFRPNLRFRDARADLVHRIASDGTLSKSAPRWLTTSNKDAVGYVVIDDDLALPLREDRTGAMPLVAVTALYRIHGHTRDTEPRRSFTSQATVRVGR